LLERPAADKLITVSRNGRGGGIHRGLGRHRALVSRSLLVAFLFAGCTTHSTQPVTNLPSATNSPAATSPAPAPKNEITAENAREGTDSWQITDPALAGEIAGYAGATSYNRGETVDLHISTRTEGVSYSIEIYRMGWYSSAGGRLVKTVERLTGRAQGYWSPGESLHACPRCKLDPATGLLDANWETSYRLKLDGSWPSGVYVAKLQGADGKQAYVPFIVRDDKRRADLLVQVSVNTWQAYNAWGDRSLYGGFNSAHTWVAKEARAKKVSFNRPYDPTESDQPANGAGEFFFWEYDFVRWAESQGYDMTYATDVDLHARTDLLKNRRGFISVGHDEYWSSNQRDQVEAARDAGVGLAFFGGNDVYWQVRFEKGADGAANRTLVCYKDAALDPSAKTDPPRTTVLWTADPVKRPQSLLTGTTYGTNATPRQQPWVVADDSSWIFAGSGLAQGDSVPGILGYEYDRLGDQASRPAGLDVVGRSPVNGFEGQDTAASTVYVAKSGAPVFAAGTIQWPWALDNFGHETIGGYADQRLQQVTKNVIAALIHGVPAK
jgi:hypothetical protein